MGKSAAMQKKHRPGQWQNPVRTIDREVDDPSFNPAYSSKAAGNRPTIDLKYHAGESSIGLMHARGQIDDAQMVAANRFRGLHERAGFRGVQAMDPSKERVDGGNCHDGLTDAKMDAAKDLKLLSAELGKIGYPVCVYIAGEGHGIAESAGIILRSKPSQRQIDYYGRLLRDSLDILCYYWGYKQPNHLTNPTG